MGFDEKYKLILVNGTVFLLFFGSAFSKPGRGQFKTQGCKYRCDTDPSGDITLEYGKDPLDITCSLHENQLEEHEKANASHRLSFERNGTPVPKEFIQTVDSTSIKLHIDRPEKGKDINYYCIYNTSLCCFNVVAVGTAPQPVTDFKCIGYNYENWTCTWTAPKNYVKTDYFLQYRPKSSLKNHSCPKIEIENDVKYSCMWNTSTDSPYRQAHDYFVLYLTARNFFGNTTFLYEYNHFKNVIPNAPIHLTAVATSPHSIRVRWEVPFAMHTFQPGLHHRIVYSCEFCNNEWTVARVIDSKNKTMEVELTDMKYAHCVYNIRVALRSAVANPDDESMWSANANANATTLSKLPGRPPKIHEGNFEIDSGGTYVIYWQQIDRGEKNGGNFSYDIEIVGKSHLRPEEIRGTYAVYKKLNTTEMYTFHIWSVNAVGRSENNTILHIPSVKQRIGKPKNFIKIAHEENMYELSWEPADRDSVSNKIVTGYTIFWCNWIRDRPYRCEGFLDWKDVSNTTLGQNITLPKTNETVAYQFAVATNSLDSTSGMQWAECTVIAPPNQGKLERVSINRIGPTFIEVNWKISFCSSGAVKGFIISYCPTNSSDRNCRVPEKNVTIVGGTSSVGNITNLVPYTTYRITVKHIVMHGTYTLPSDAVYGTTMETAPGSAPRNIRVLNVTNSSLLIKWDPPIPMNGQLKKYRVYYNDKYTDVGTTETTLTDLDSYKTYNISVKALTSEWSPLGSFISETTKMWYPGKVGQPSFNSRNETFVEVKWDKPEPPRGRNDYYEVQFVRKLDSDVNSIQNSTFRVTDNKFVIGDCGESGKYNTFNVSVRAVNIADNNTLFVGPWSEPGQSFCGYQHTSWIYIVLPIIGIFVLLIAFYLFRRLFAVCQEMQDVGVKLPPGLAPAIDRDLVPWKIDKLPESDTEPPHEGQVLLEEVSLKQSHNSENSSGCSSGHESVSSGNTVESASSTDSGTEQPGTPTPEDLRNQQLRQRKMPPSKMASGYVQADAIIPQSARTVPKTTSSSNYCVLGLTEPPNVMESTSPSVPLAGLNADKPYVSCNPTITSPPSYSVSNEVVKVPNPGYVTLPSQEPTDRNTSYVLAGIPTEDALVPDLMQTTDKPDYVRTDPNLLFIGDRFPWQSNGDENPTLPKAGYVCVGDTPRTKTNIELNSNKGYVPHMRFEVKSLKED